MSSRLPHLPSVARLNGVTVPMHRPAGIPTCRRDHKTANVDAVRETVRRGDTVVCIGIGEGVSPVHAARTAGRAGETIAYDGARACVDRLATTCLLNRVAIEGRHAIVGTARSLASAADGAAHVTTADLPAMDVLEVDAEGAELDVLPALGDVIRPRAVVVETHPRQGAPTEAVVGLLADGGYRVTERRVDAEAGHVLVAEVAP